ncbi:MAG: hypothetical protein Fur0015_03910 [Ignavibacteriales bacterium]
MKVNYLYFFLLLLTINPISLFAQESSTDIFVIDSYITPEKPYLIRVSFITSDSVQSKIIFNNKLSFDVSKDFVGTHKFETNLENIKLESTSSLLYVIQVKDSAGNISESESNELSLPVDLSSESTKGDLFTLCLGGTVFLFPNPTLVITKEKKYFSFTKEIPIVSFFSKGYNYPVGYFSAEYSYIEKIRYNHFLRVGYKQMIHIPYLEYVSIGLNGFTDFKGKNGVSPEVSVGLIRLYNIFTLFGRYRFNIKPNDGTQNFHEITIGLYSNFLSINF